MRTELQCDVRFVIRAIVRSRAARYARILGVLAVALVSGHARAQALLVRVPFERERDETVEEGGIGEAGGFP